MRNHDGGAAPWAMSSIGPCELVTAAEMTSEQLKIGRQAALSTNWEKENQESRERWKKVAESEVDDCLLQRAR